MWLGLFPMPVQADPCDAAAEARVLRWTPEPIARGRRVLKVGPGQALATPAAAARAARDGDVVLIEAGEYTDQRAIWPQDGLLIRGVNGRPRLVAGERLAQAKAIWVINGDGVTVENLEFTGARARSHNGAGIRAQGTQLTVRASVFTDSDMGILTANAPDQDLVVEHSEFARNGHANGRAHNIYVGAIRRFEMRFSHSHDSRGGHLVKTRAMENLIEYNRLEDGPDGTASYELDISRGRDAIVVGNLIVQSAGSPNSAMLAYGAEDRDRPPTGRLQVAHNTFYSFRPRPVFIFNHTPDEAVVARNLFSGAAGSDVRGPASLDGNETLPSGALRAPEQQDFRPSAPRPAQADRGQPHARLPAELTPRFEYLDPLAGRARGDRGPGAFAACRPASRQH